MAFVAESERKLSEISKTVCPVGPGQYFKEVPQAGRKEYAPFQSLTKRKTFLEPSNVFQPGPGNYEVSKPFVEPNIKTVSNSQSIIVKINSTGTSQFKSVVDRFEGRRGENPGPGEYSIQYPNSNKQRSQSQRSMPKSNSHIQIEHQKHYPTIPERIRGLTDTKKQFINPEGKVGPGQYNPHKTSYLNSTSTVWGKDKVKRFSIDESPNVGPGQYNVHHSEDKQEKVSSQFKSATVRTYFDSLLYKTNTAEIAKQRDSLQYKSTEPAPGQYETNRSSIKLEQKPFSLQFFGSTVERFPEEEYEEKRHKSYVLRSTIGQSKSFNTGEHAFLSDSLRDPQYLNSHLSNNPGPGQYPNQIQIERKLKGNKIEKFGSNSKRIFQKEEVVDEIGPGKYTPDDNKILEERNTRFGQVGGASSNFKSSTKRECFGKEKETCFVQYDISHYDLSKKLEKQKNFIDNLKKIDVQKAPFESGIPRFEHYSTQRPSSRKLSLQENSMQEIRQLKEEERARDIILEANLSQVRQAKKNNFGTSNRFNNEKQNAPPVGHYSQDDNWGSRSYNVKYAQR